MTRTIKARLKCILSFRNVFICVAVCCRDLAREFGGDVLIGALLRGCREYKDILPK